jgi:hypothetical protein
MTRICREAEASLDYYAMFKNILKQVRVAAAFLGGALSHSRVLGPLHRYLLLCVYN